MIPRPAAQRLAAHSTGNVAGNVTPQVNPEPQGTNLLTGATISGLPGFTAEGQFSTAQEIGGREPLAQTSLDLDRFRDRHAARRLIGATSFTVSV